MSIVVKISSQTGNWVNFKYIASNARSRMKLDKFVEQHEQGAIEIINPEMIEQK